MVSTADAVAERLEPSNKAISPKQSPDWKRAMSLFRPSPMMCILSAGSSLWKITSSRWYRRGCNLIGQRLELVSVQIGEYSHSGEKSYVDHDGYFPVSVTASAIISLGVVNEA